MNDVSIQFRILILFLLSNYFLNIEFSICKFDLIFLQVKILKFIGVSTAFVAFHEGTLLTLER